MYGQIFSHAQPVRAGRLAHLVERRQGLAAVVLPVGVLRVDLIQPAGDVLTGRIRGGRIEGGCSGGRCGGRSGSAAASVQTPFSHR